MGACHFELVGANACDSDLVGGSDEESGKGGTESDLASAGKTCGNAHHVLLSDEAFDK